MCRLCELALTLGSLHGRQNAFCGLNHCTDTQKCARQKKAALRSTAKAIERRRTRNGPKEKKQERHFAIQSPGKARTNKSRDKKTRSTSTPRETGQTNGSSSRATHMAPVTDHESPHRPDRHIRTEDAWARGKNPSSTMYLSNILPNK